MNLHPNYNLNNLNIMLKTIESYFSIRSFGMLTAIIFGVLMLTLTTVNQTDAQSTDCEEYTEWAMDYGWDCWAPGTSCLIVWGCPEDEPVVAP